MSDDTQPENPKNARPRARQLLLLKLLGAVLASVTLIEIGARLLVPKQENVRLQQFAKVVEGKHEVTFAEVFEWDPERFWRLVPNVSLPEDAWPLFGRISNDRGLREARDLPLEKPAGETRVLFVGDSCIFGYQVAYDESIPELVETNLKQERRGQKIECINAGVPGYSLFQGWRYLETEGFDFDPDLVVVNFGWNASTPWDGVGDAEQLEIIRAGRPPAWLGWSRASEIVFEGLAQKRFARPKKREDGKPNIRPRLSPDEFGQVLEAIHAATQKRGVGLMILVPAMKMNLEGQRMVRTLYQAKQFEFAGRFVEGAKDAPGLIDGVRILRSFQKQNPKVEIFSDGVHTTAAANVRLAERISGRINAWLQAR